MKKNKMKNILGIILIMALIVSPFHNPILSSANSSQSIKYEIVDGVLKKYNGTDKIVKIPDGVKKIAMHAFYWNDNIEKVEIPEGVEVIEEECFYVCTNLKEINIPGSVKKIVSSAFSWCDSLEKVELGDGIEEIGNNCFSFYKNLKEISIPGSIKKISSTVLDWCNDELKIKCCYGSVAYNYAQQKNITIGKLYNIPYYISVNSYLNKVIDTSTQKKLKGKKISLETTITNNAEENYIYDKDDMAQKKLRNISVKIKLPKELKFKDKSSIKVLKINDIDISKSLKLNQSVYLNETINDNNTLTAVFTVKADDFSETFSCNLASCGLDIANKKSISVKNYKFETNKKIESTNCSEKVTDWYGSISETAEYKIGNKYYIFYQIPSKKGWKLSGMILDNNFKLKKKITFPYISKYEKFGNVIVDSKENYYVVCGHEDKEHENENNTKVLAVIKYDNNLKEIGKCEYSSNETGEDSGGMRNPFEFGECSVVIDNTGRLICNCATIMYNTHQRSHVICVDTKTMKKENIEGPYCSHSLAQQVYLTDNSEIICLNKGDGYPRGIQMTKIDSSLKHVYSKIIFHTSSGKSYQNTLTALGGFADMKDGYLVSASSEKELSKKYLKDDWVKERNIFIQLVNKNWERSWNFNNAMLLDTPVRYVEDASANTDLEQKKDNGVLWLTNYKGADYASISKVVKLTDESAAIFWEKRNYTKKKGDRYVGTYYCIIDQYGKILTGETQIKNAKLSNNDNMIYYNNRVYWTTNDEKKTTKLVLHELELPTKN